MILFVDTETYLNEAQIWAIKQISWLVYDKYGVLIKEINHFIDENIDTKKTIFLQFEEDVKLCDVIVGHNIYFDYSVINHCFNECGISSNIENKICYDTMTESKDFCSIEGLYGFKWPKLGELYFKIFKKDLVGAHDALIDIKATASCFWYLYDSKILLENKHQLLIDKLKSEEQMIIDNLETIYSSVATLLTEVYKACQVGAIGHMLKVFGKERKIDNIYNILQNSKRSIILIEEHEKVFLKNHSKRIAPEIFKTYIEIGAIDECLNYLKDINFYEDSRYIYNYHSSFAKIYLKDKIDRKDTSEAILYSYIFEIVKKRKDLLSFLEDNNIIKKPGIKQSWFSKLFN